MGLDSFNNDGGSSADSSDDSEDTSEVVESDTEFPSIDEVENALEHHALNTQLDVEVNGPRLDAKTRDLAMLFIEMCMKTGEADPKNIHGRQ
jgi:hypothetical protein